MKLAILSDTHGLLRPQVLKEIFSLITLHLTKHYR